MGIFNKFIVFLVFISLSAIASSRPISWSGGSTIMYQSNSMYSSYYYHFSPTYKYSVGAEYINNRYFNEQYINLKTTYLLNRKNTKMSQGNLYLTGGISTKSKDNFFYGVHGDWETRRIFTSFSHIKKHTNTINYAENEFKFGVAPYLGEYNDLHTWLMLKTKKDTINNIWETYPFIKLFKGDSLLEIGTKSSHWDIHYMFRF
tara:strand:- start:824 stop:1432 length:609 start_codon:yes stop_codon:yes gene_type:complete